MDRTLIEAIHGSARYEGLPPRPIRCMKGGMPDSLGPNVLLVVATQWRGQALGCSGDPNARTPHLDAFASGAVRFTEAVTPHPFGPFARAALLTGVPSPENGVCDYFDPLPRSSRTLAHRFGERGYATAFVGGWHLARRDPAALLVGEAHARTKVAPEDRGGFGHWDGFEGGFLLNDPWLQGTHSPEPRRLRGYQSDVLAELALQWIASAPRPWFCLVSLEPPHPPYAAAGVRSRPEELHLTANVPRGGEAEARARRELSGYYGQLEATDRALGRLFAATPATDARIVFTSVHGDMHGAHGLFRKGWPYEESIRIPLLWREPGLRAEARVDDPVSLLDLGRGVLA
ncbi:MAG: sulfatase-like hydrolase/transferase, partial [Opitutaceae bacterium]